MASIAVSPTLCRAVTFDEMSQLTLPLSADYSAGTLVRKGTDGRWVAADASTAGGVLGPLFLLNNTGLENQFITGYNRCEFDLGPSALDGASVGVVVYASDTAGEITLVVGESTATRIIGTVEAVWRSGSNTPDLILRMTE